MAPGARASGGGPRLLLWLAVAILLVAGFFLVPKIYRSFSGTPAPPSIQSSSPPPPPRQAPVDEPEEEIVLPDLDQSDSLVRALVDQMSAHPEIVRWLAPDDLVLRFVAAVDNVAQGDAPGPRIEVARPGGAFEVVRRRGRTYIDPASYRRYDPLVDAIESMDVLAMARALETLEPLLDEAYQKLGYPQGEFRPVLHEAIAEVVSAPRMVGPIEVVPKVTTYELADPLLEASSPAAKILIRMGPDNAGRLQAKLRELQSVLGRG